MTAPHRERCSADWQSAVSRIGNPQASADFQSAIQQINNLRYGLGWRQHPERHRFLSDHEI